MEQYNKFFDFILSCNDKISPREVIEPLNSLFHSFGLNNIGDGICWVFIRCCQYTEHFTISLLNEMNSKFQDQLIKTTEIVKESINKLFHEQELKINKIKSENEEFKGLFNNLANEIRELKQKNENLEIELIYQNDTLITGVEEIKKMKETEKFHDINKELNILSSEVMKLKKENEKLRSSNNELESIYYNMIDEIHELKEHASSLSDRLQDLEVPIKQSPPLILI